LTKLQHARFHQSKRHAVRAIGDQPQVQAPSCTKTLSQDSSIALSLKEATERTDAISAHLFQPSMAVLPETRPCRFQGSSQCRRLVSSVDLITALQHFLI
jgi:hypothetical protein